MVLKDILSRRLNNAVQNMGTISEIVTNKEKPEADLNKALEIAGFGCYNLKYSLVLALFLIAVIVEPFGYSFILPAAKCDLHISDAERGFIASIPFIGIVITSFMWGYLVDNKGRKKVAIWSSVVAGAFAMLAAFMPEINSFIVCKFITALCIAGPAAVPYAFIGEIVPPSLKDLTLTFVNALQIAGCAIVPLLAWGVLPLDFRIDFGLYEFRSWRLLTMLNGTLFIIAAILMSFGPESPNFLIAKGKTDEALKVVKTIYAGNKRKSPEEYPIKRLIVRDTIQATSQNFLNSLREQTLPLLKAPLHKWLALNSILLFGVFAALNGLYVWVPDIINRTISGDASGVTACEAIGLRLNETAITGECDDSITTSTFIINLIANAIVAVISVIASGAVKFVGKKIFLIFNFCLIGLACTLVTTVTQSMVYTVFLSSIPMLGMTIGPVNAYAVEVFPSHIRGMAINLSMMVGRLGSVVGANLAGLLIVLHCPSTFFVFGGSLFLCALLCLLLPRMKKIAEPE